jgi:hypothetical protein
VAASSDASLTDDLMEKSMTFRDTKKEEQEMNTRKHAQAHASTRSKKTGQQSPSNGTQKLKLRTMGRGAN